MNNLVFLSLNVRGLSNARKRRAIFTWCKKQNADVVFLQETHSTKSTENMWNKSWGGDAIYFSHGKSNARGTCILIRPSLNADIVKQVTDSSGRLVLLKVIINNTNYCLVNVYGPNNPGQSADFFDRINSILRAENIDNSDNIIMGGDFNACFNPYLDRYGYNLTVTIEPPHVQRLIKLKENLELQDIWRIKNPNLRSYTWSRPGKFQFSRIDFWLTSTHLQDGISLTDIIPSIRSDHSVITLNLCPPNDDVKGPGFWKMNTSLLNDSNYKNMMQTLLHSLINDQTDDFLNLNARWEWIKYNIRKETMSYSKHKAFQRKKKEKDLQDELKKSYVDFEQNPCIDTKSKWLDLKRQLEVFYDKEIEGMIIRSKIKWFEEGEKSSKYFLNLEKRNYARKHITKLLVNDKVITNQKDILKAQHNFYKELYSKTNNVFSRSDLDSLLENVEVPKLNKEMSDSCEGYISEGECDKVLKSFANGKSPGNDGIPAEFYKEFWDIIKPTLISCFNESYDSNKLPVSQTQAVITLVEKRLR